MKYVENIEKTVLERPVFQDRIMILQLTMDSFELKYEKFMDKNAKNDFELIKNSVSVLIDSVK